MNVIISIFIFFQEIRERMKDNLSRDRIGSAFEGSDTCSKNGDVKSRVETILTNNSSNNGSKIQLKTGFGTSGGPIKADRIVLKPSNITFNKKQ